VLWCCSSADDSLLPVSFGKWSVLGILVFRDGAHRQDAGKGKRARGLKSSCSIVTSEKFA